MAARRAGIQADKAATLRSRMTEPIIVTGSCGLIPKKMLHIKRLRAKATGKPIDIPIDDRITLRNQIKKFIQDHYYQKIRNVWEKIYGVDKYTL